jgi:hypothetical protein
MSKTVKYILITVVILAIIALFVFSDKVSLGPIIAGAAGLFAAIKARLFGSGDLKERVEKIQEEHTLKREEWNRIKEEYDSKFRALKARMDYLDYRSAKISEEIGDLDTVEKQALQNNAKLTDEEILARLRNI